MPGEASSQSLDWRQIHTQANVSTLLGDCRLSQDRLVGFNELPERPSRREKQRPIFRFGFEPRY
jgi:hypothetical protein